MSGHLVLADMARGREALVAARDLVGHEFGIRHVTIQTEDRVLREAEGEISL